MARMLSDGICNTFTDHAIAAAVDCPGECIFLEDEALDGTDDSDDSDDSDISDADVVDVNTEP